MAMAGLILSAAMALSLIMTIAWWLQNRSGHGGWIDTLWSSGTGLVGAGLALTPLGAEEPTARQWLVAALVALWGGRLGLHLLQRTLTTVEDARYSCLREEWGDDAHRRMFRFAQIQALAGLGLALTVLVASRRPGDFGWQDVAGAAVLLGALLGESLADRQLRAFAQDKANKGKVCDVGLWKWSRHPNYFFQFLGWVAYPMIAIDFSGGYPWGWLALTGPAFIWYLLVHVSGIPPLEQHMLRSRGQAFRDYQARTSAFVPLPPRGE
jgi:steroid 5-alpha reductase family enzyme